MGKHETFDSTSLTQNDEYNLQTNNQKQSIQYLLLLNQMLQQHAGLMPGQFSVNQYHWQEPSLKSISNYMRIRWNTTLIPRQQMTETLHRQLIVATISNKLNMPLESVTVRQQPNKLNMPLESLMFRQGTSQGIRAITALNPRSRMLLR